MITSRRRQAKSLALFTSALMPIFAVLPKAAQAYDVCDNKIEIEKGERPGGPFFGLGYGMTAHALAEKFCGASPRPMAPRFLAYAEKQGCGPGTEIYSELKDASERIERADLETLAGGDATLQLSSEQVQEWAAAAAKGFGGCEALIEWHDRE